MDLAIYYYSDSHKIDLFSPYVTRNKIIYRAPWIPDNRSKRVEERGNMDPCHRAISGDGGRESGREWQGRRLALLKKMALVGEVSAAVAWGD